jgi:hypothetical protein
VSGLQAPAGAVQVQQGSADQMKVGTGVTVKYPIGTALVYYRCNVPSHDQVWGWIRSVTCCNNRGSGRWYSN